MPVGKTPWHPAHHQSTAQTWHRPQGHALSTDLELAEPALAHALAGEAAQHPGQDSPLEQDQHLAVCTLSC